MDFGGHLTDGPSSIWSVREFQSLEGVSDARRGADYLCQFAGAEQSRPIGVFANYKGPHKNVSMERPRWRRLRDTSNNNGPLPNRCQWTPHHKRCKDLNEAEDFVSFSSPTLGVRFWTWYVAYIAEFAGSLSHNDGGRPTP